MDPLQFKYPIYTPFQYAGNMPISYIDLDGAEPKRKTQKFVPISSFSADNSSLMIIIHDRRGSKKVKQCSETCTT